MQSARALGSVCRMTNVNQSRLVVLHQIKIRFSLSICVAFGCTKCSVHPELYIMSCDGRESLQYSSDQL